MRLIALLRVSSEGQLDGYGLDSQRAVVKQWAKANGHRIVAWHEADERGALDLEDRPVLSAAIDDVRHRVGEGLIVPRLDRLARSLTVQEDALGVIWQAGGRVFTADQGEVLPDDPDDPMRTALRQVVGAFAQLDRSMVVKRLRDGRRAKAAAGRKATGSYAYGWQGIGKGRARDAAPNPEESAAVARILELRAAGASYRQIAAALDAEGHRPRRAQHWSAMVVRSIAQREAARAVA